MSTGRKNRDRLLEPLAIELLEVGTQFGRLAEDQVETIAAIALTDIADDPLDKAFVLFECLTLLMRDGQFARMKLLATRLREVERSASEGRPFLMLAISVMASTLSGSPTRATRDIERGLAPDVASQLDAPGETTRRDLAVAAAIRAAFVDDDPSYAMRARELMVRLGDGLAIAILDCVIAWQHAHRGGSV